MIQFSVLRKYIVIERYISIFTPNIGICEISIYAEINI